LLSGCVFALLLAAIGSVLLAGFTALLVLFVLLIPVLLLLFALALTGRGKVSIRVRRARREPATQPGDDVAKLKRDR
jgi:hypothetical protein